jgi:hypothetical protein
MAWKPDSTHANQNIRLKTPETTSKPIRKMMPTIHKIIFMMNPKWELNSARKINIFSFAYVIGVTAVIKFH